MSELSDLQDHSDDIVEAIAPSLPTEVRENDPERPFQ
jgi:hypothetical protein